MKNYLFISIGLLGAFVLFAGGCSSYDKEPDFQSELAPDISPDDRWPPKSSIYTQRFVWKMRYVAEQLAKRTGKSSRSDGERTVLVTTIAPVDDIYKPTSFGRLCTEQLITELTAIGFKVIEARKTVGYYIKDKEGEFALSRDADKIPIGHEVEMVLVGLFAKSGPETLLNVRLVDAYDSHVLSAATAQMDLRGDMFLNSIMEKSVSKPSMNKMGMKQKKVSNKSFIGLQKKVDEDNDHYSDMLAMVVRDMAHKIVYASLNKESATQLKVVVTTFVDVDNFNRAATFGRYMTDKLIGDLVSMGVDVTEVRVAPDLFSDIRIGELIMTRELSRIFGASDADAYLLGSYTKTEDKILVNGRLVLAASNKVIGVGDMVVDAGSKNKFIASMFKNEVTNIPPTETVEGY